MSANIDTVGETGFGEFAASFQAVENNPLNESIQYALWLAANSADTEIPGNASAAPLKQLSDKRIALVAGPGIHYIEESSMMGFSIATEYWIKNGKFKKVEESMVTIFDGESYVQYDPVAKTGDRYTKEFMSADITIQVNGMLASLAAAGYKQLEDQTIGGFNCSVFFLDMEVMGIQGNTLFVDKETGMLIKYQVGDDENGISTVVTMFETGGFGDDVFTVPADITVTDYVS